MACPSPHGFCKFLALWTSLMGAFFNVGFFGPNPHGPRPSPVGWAKLTPLIKTLKKIQKV